MCPPSLNTQYRTWINELLRIPDGHSKPVQQLVISAYECAISILNSAGSYPTEVESFNAYQVDLFLFKDMGLGGILSKFISRMNDQRLAALRAFACQSEFPLGTSPSMMTTWPTSRLQTVMLC